MATPPISSQAVEFIGRHSHDPFFLDATFNANRRASRSTARRADPFWRSVAAGRTMHAVRCGDLKLVLDSNQLFLYDISRDPDERSDPARFRTADARSLRQALPRWEHDVNTVAARRPQ